MRTEEQRAWLDQHPNFAEVVHLGVWSSHDWRDEGWLSKNGKYLIDDGKTLFAANYPAWFGRTGAIRVGRKVARVFA